MSLENEYYNEKQLLENAREKLAKMEEMDVKNMTQEQLDARERVIKSAKEDIEESEELLNEIKEELIEFVNNGGEVSEGILNEIKEEESSSSNSFEAFDVSFKVVSNRNPEVYMEGYVTINDEESEDVDWYFWNSTGYQSRRFIFHDGISIKGSTIEQENELAQFESDLSDEGIWIDDVIIQSDENENKTYIRNDITLIVNDGFDVELVCIKKIGDDWGGNNLLFRYNIKKLPLDSDEDINEKLYYINKRCDFEWRHYESYDNMDYNGHFFEAVYIDKDNQMHKIDGEKVIITDEFICELMESDCVAAVQELLGIY